MALKPDILWSKPRASIRNKYWGKASTLNSKTEGFYSVKLPISFIPLAHSPHRPQMINDLDVEVFFSQWMLDESTELSYTKEDETWLHFKIILCRTSRGCNIDYTNMAGWIKVRCWDSQGFSMGWVDENRQAMKLESRWFHHQTGRSEQLRMSSQVRIRRFIGPIMSLTLTKQLQYHPLAIYSGGTEAQQRAGPLLANYQSDAQRKALSGSSSAAAPEVGCRKYPTEGREGWGTLTEK